MKYILVYAIRFYQQYLAHHKLPTCKYYPSCSEYAIEVIKKEGATAGTIKTLWRLLKCNPFSKGGYDPA